MQDLMPPINTSDSAFHDGDPTTGQLGTIVTALWLNNVQSATRDVQLEIKNVLAKAGIQPDPKNTNQLAEAISQIIGSGNYASTAYVDNGLNKKIDKANISGVLGNDNNKVPNLNLLTTELGKKQPTGNYALKGDSYTKGETDSKYATNEALENTTSETIFARAIAIPLNSDLNDYLNPGLYFQPNGSPGVNGKNYPSNTAGSLEVIKTGNTSVKQVYTAWYDNKTWVRRYNGGNKAWADKWDEDFTKLNPPTASEVGAYSSQQADAKFQLKGSYLDKDSTQEQITKGFLTATRRLSAEAPDKARAILYAVESGNVGISAQDSTGKWLGDIKHPANGKNGTLAIVEQLIGEGQAWVNVTSQRQSKVTYTNETSKPIQVCVVAYAQSEDSYFMVNNVRVALIGYSPTTSVARPLSVIVPVGAKYSISNTIGDTYSWSELR